MSWELRPYQVDARRAIQEGFRAGLHGVTFEMATGTGKGNLIADFAQSTLLRGKRVLVAVNRDVLVLDLFNRMRRMGLHPIMEKGLEKASPLSQLVVASIQTSQGKRREKWAKDHFGLIITDEVHGSASRTFKDMLTYFEGAYHIGATATLERHDKKGLCGVYEKNVYSYPLQQAINDGWLTPLEIEELPVPIHIDDETASKRVFTEVDEAGVFEKDNYLPRLFSEAASRSHGKKGLFFWPNCKSSEEAAKHFAQAGIDGRHIAGDMSKGELEKLYAWFATPGPKCMHNADLLSYGYDNPSIDLVGIMRISRSIPMLKQRVGRGTRTICGIDQYATPEARKQAIADSAKPHCTILDLMIQIGDVKHTFADATALITDNDEEREFLRKERSQSSCKFTAEELENKLKVKRKTDEEAALAKLAEDAANSAMKAATRKGLPYLGHILGKPARPGYSPASDKQRNYLRFLGFHGIAPSGWHASRIIDAIKTHREKYA